MILKNGGSHLKILADINNQQPEIKKPYSSFNKSIHSAILFLSGDGQPF